MPVTITGGKYAIRSLSAAATTTVTIGTGTFVSGDFGATQRMVALYTSGNAFKGIAWVRRFVSTTQLELEGQFVDPVTGLFATQVVGDQVLVSKNSSESAATGFAVSFQGNLVTVTDNILMGTAGSETSLCYYDENMQYSISNGFTFLGGVAVYGKLVSYDGVSKESFIWTRECTIRPNNDLYPAGGGTPAFNVWGTGGTSAHMFFFGGAVGSPMRRSFFIGAQTTGATNKTFAFFGTRLYYACASPSNGANWASNPDRHLLYKTIHEADYTNANLIVWGNGAFQGSFLSFPQFGAGTPVGIFRASTTASFGATANNRTVVADTGSGAFIDDVNNGGPYTFTNTITPFVTITRNTSGTVVPITFQFSDDYTNLKNRSTVAVVRGDGVLATSVVNTANSTFTATVVQSTYAPTTNGTATPTAFYTTFNYTVKCYGFQVVSGTHLTYSYSLGTAGNGTDLKLGGLINQVADAGVTLTETQALALSSKFSINLGSKTVTVTANATYDELYDYTVAWNCSSAANAVAPALSQYLLTYNGEALTAFAGWTLVVNSSVTLSEGVKFKRVRFDTVTVNGLIAGVYSNSTGTNYIADFTVSEGSSVYIGNSSTGITKLFLSDVDAGTYRAYYEPGTAPTVLVARELYTFQRFAEVLTLSPGLNEFVPIDIPDVGITETDLATVQAYTEITTASRFYDRTAAFRLTEQGIKLGQMVTRSGTALEIGNFSHLINKDAASVYSVTGSVITTKSTEYAGDSKYQTEIAIPPATIEANSTEIITINREDANGNSSVNIQASGISTFEIWKISDATDPDDYATGELLDTVGVGIYRFISANGFKMVIRDTTTNFRVVSEMEKGNYEAALFFGPAVQLAQAPQVIENGIKLDVLALELEEIKGTGFATNKQSLVKLRQHITNMNNA